VLNSRPVKPESVALEFEEALARVLSVATCLTSERTALLDARGRVLAEDIVAACDLPRFSYSAMDGYALASAELVGSPPYELGVSGESRAGAEPPELVPGSAVRISTGAAMPARADSVVMNEDVERTTAGVRLNERPSPGDNLRKAGEDLARGSIAVARGTRLSPFHLGLLASLDRQHVAVTRRPRLALLSTGDELRDPGSMSERAYAIPESNGVALASLAIERCSAEIVATLRARDDRDEIRDKLRSLAALAPDVLITIGGASVGEHDHVKQALEAEGAALSIYKVKMKPGKPFGFGRIGSSLVLGLPGNPVSAALGFALFGLPLLRALGGETRTRAPRHTRTLAAPLRQKTGRLGFYRATLDGDRVLPDANQASGSSVSLARADALIVMPSDVEALQAGASVEVLLLSEL
jgi:molybdopterin molybdotransferase